MSRIEGKFNSILCISDQHFPYNHPDIIAFLRECKNKFKPDIVINMGDELDYHSISFHKPNPDLLSPGDELQTAINRIQPLFKMFPDMHIMDSNHGSLVYRRIKDAGIPMHVVKSYRDVLGAPAGWKWHNDLILELPNGQDTYFCHGGSNNVAKESQLHSMNFVSGHWHSTFEIKYWANKKALYWGMSTGCLVDQSSLAYEYAKNFTKKFIIGTGVIIDSLPRLVPMVLDKHSRWVNKII